MQVVLKNFFIIIWPQVFFIKLKYMLLVSTSCSDEVFLEEIVVLGFQFKTKIDQILLILF